jgi:hypothetical protein
LLEARDKVEQRQQYFDELKHQLQMMMKEAERAVFTGGSVMEEITGLYQFRP